MPIRCSSPTAVHLHTAQNEPATEPVRENAASTYRPRPSKVPHPWSRSRRRERDRLRRD